MNKQIEEMAKLLCIVMRGDCDACYLDDCPTCPPKREAERLYNAGYRKQSEGCDFCKEGNEKCGTCVRFFDYYEDGNW